jgi:hypothetical protein
MSFPLHPPFCTLSLTGSLPTLWLVHLQSLLDWFSYIPTQFQFSSCPFHFYSSVLQMPVQFQFSSSPFHFYSSAHYPVSFSLSTLSLSVAVKRGFNLTVGRSILNLTGCAMQPSSYPTEPSCSLFKPLSTSQFAC